MRQMSFMLTTPQMLNRTKTVTRRLGWKNLKPGTLLQAVEKSQGLGKGGKVRKLGVIRVVSVTHQKLFMLAADARYGKVEAGKEGFPHMSGRRFLCMFMAHMHCKDDQVVTRIEFEHVEEPQS